jgi:hypothetical protein
LHLPYVEFPFSHFGRFLQKFRNILDSDKGETEESQ